MQVDHLHPKYLSHLEPNLDNNRHDNLMPACRKCNIHKHAMRLEMWRNELSLQITRLKKNTQFDRALRFKQLEIKEVPIVFYFERRMNLDC
jgi:5-methylcytosine-specific restriction endonuclease McrA